MLADFQNVLVHLAVDARLRACFSVDRAEVLARYDLDQQERDALTALDLLHLERYAAALLHKRVKEFAPHVSMTSRVVPDLVERYRAYLAEHPAQALAGPAVLPPGLQEGLRVCEPLCRALRKDDSCPDYAADLLGLELFEAASRVDGQVRFWRAPCRVDLVAIDIKRGQVPFDPARAPTLFRFSASGVGHKPLVPRDAR